MKRSGLTAKLLTGVLSLSLLTAAALTSAAQLQSESIAAYAAQGDRFKSDNICFEETKTGDYRINSYSLDENSPVLIEIPDTYDGKNVTGLSFDMFTAEEDFSLKDKVYDIRLGKNIKDIEAYAFRGINIASITVDPENQYFSVYDGMLCSKNGKSLIYCPDTLTGEIKLPGTIVSAAQGAFVSSKAEALSLGANVKYLPEDITQSCPSLKSYAVSKDNNYFSTHKGVLLNKDKTAIVSYPAAKDGAYAVPETVSEINSKAFSGAGLLTKVYLKNTRIIGDHAFYGCTGLKSITITDSVENIGDSAFANCTGIGFAVFPDSLKAIPYGMFSGCTALKRFNVPASLESVGCRAFDDTKWHNSLASGFVYIGDKILYGYKSSDTEEEASDDASREQTLDIREGTISVTDFALSGSGVVKVNIPSSLTNLGAYSLYPREGLTEFTVSPDNPALTVSDGILFSKDMKKLIAVPENYKSDIYTIPFSVKEICGTAFSFNKNIVEIQVHEDVAAFGKSPFNNGNSDRTVVCVKKSAAHKAAQNDNVNVVYETPQISISKSEMTVGVGETYQLSAKVSPEFVDSSVRWKSTNNSIVYVSEGKITAKRTGTATITAVSRNGSTAKCKVTVRKAPAKVTFSKASLTLGANEKFTLYTSVDSGSAAVTRRYTSSDESIVSIDKNQWNCCLTAHKPGTAVITAQLYNGLTAKCTVTVKNAPDKVEMSETQVTIGVGETVLLCSSVNNGAASTYRKYESSDSNVAEINPTSWNCSFTGISVGSAAITVRTYNGKTAVCKITVKSPPRGVRLPKSEIIMGAGETTKISTIFLDGDYSRKTYFTVSDESVLSIVKNGRECEFKALKEGTANLIVHTYNGLTAKCRITVKPSPKKIYLNRGLIVMKVGDNEELSSYLDSGYAAVNRTYRTSNKNVVEMTAVNWIGKFRAVAPGTAYVTVRTQTGIEKSCKIVVEE